MAEDETYNGWTNYETWVTKLWFDNEEYTYHLLTDEVPRWAREALPEARRGWSEDEDAGIIRTNAEYLAAKQLREWFEESYEVPVTGVLADLLGHAIDRVEWVEIARAYLDDVEWYTVEEDEDDHRPHGG